MTHNDAQMHPKAVYQNSQYWAGVKMSWTRGDISGAAVIFFFKDIKTRTG